MDRNELIEYARSVYGAEPEYLWEKTPDCFILRHDTNRKWFAVVMDVPKSRLGLAGDETVCVLDVKCGPIMGGSYTGKKGFLPAYHMNKTNWITVLLDGSAPREDIAMLLDVSYDLTK